jgi:hypothetical protein
MLALSCSKAGYEYGAIAVSMISETLANYDNRFSRIDSEVLKVQSELVLVKWMVGFGIALNVAILTRLFFH